ncbi:unnamed protein product [Periconia digitata]|uniref:SWR1-complex protein 4 n=1 Tax=Periconia digitata TaxID=1303443 RepID=A0A9W4UNC7_9PLEO|nr:unnamed protein product [Periconia digitata]
MATGRDVRDMLGLPMGAGAGEQAKAAKKSKTTGGVKRMQGVAREVAALYGERPPPVAVYEEEKTYRAKRQNTGPAKKWVQQDFVNQARNDGLVLKHWRRKHAPAPPVQDGEDTAMEETDITGPYIENCGDFNKYNISVDLPTFSDEEYEAHLRSNDWSREETDYLFEVVRDYSYRWAVVWDRYDYQPGNNSALSQEGVDGDDGNALAAMPFAPPKQRSVEDLKARFYDISAKLMKLRIPEMQMDADQYSTYEILSKFDPLLERNRKALASALMNRSMDEVKEEEFLLTELQRINMAANRLDAEREELRARLDAPAPNTQIAAGLQSFTSSQALQTLFSQLFQQDRSKKRASGGGSGPSRLSLNTNDLAQTPASTVPGPISAVNRRQSMALPQSAAAQTPVRTLPPQQERRYNVSTHDRLTSGVSFGADRLVKMRQAKSNVQTQKIAAALHELGVPDLIPIPTSRVGEAFESLIGKVGKLLDVRKVREKEEGEIRVLEAMKEAKGGSSTSSNNNATATDDKRSTSISAPPADRRSSTAAPASTPKTTTNNGTTTSTSKRNEIPDSNPASPLDNESSTRRTSRDPTTTTNPDEDDDQDDDQDDEEDDVVDIDTSHPRDNEEDGDDEDAEGEEESRQPSEAPAHVSTQQQQQQGRKRSASEFSAGSASVGSGVSKRARK